MNTQSQKLAGKVAVVTGASKGIGAAIARQLAAEGAAVVVNYSASKAGAEKVVAEIKAEGGKAVAVQANVAKKPEIEKLVAETKKAFGPIDILVNNAGIYEFAPLEQITEEHFRKQFDLNVLGLLLTLAAGPLQAASDFYVNNSVVLCPPEIPPQVDATNFVNNNYFSINFLDNCDMYHAPHIANPFLLYMLTGSWIASFFVSGAFEIVEAIFFMIKYNSGDTTAAANVYENLPDILIDDWLIQAGLGTLLGAWVFW